MNPAISEALKVLRHAIEASPDRWAAVDAVRALVHDLSPSRGDPVDFVRWVPIERVRANDYNPNSVASNEMRLLHTSIAHDGYTQPVVAIKDGDDYVIVDGFHRYSIMKLHADVRGPRAGMLPVVVIDKGINDRMAATVRHNRARGKHAVASMADMVYAMLTKGWNDARICGELGLSADELAKLKHTTGYSKLYAHVEYRNAWETDRQIQLRKEHEAREATAGADQALPSQPA